MINKQNLWFITLFSLILILGIYYINIEDEVTAVLKTEEISENSKEVIEKSDLFIAEISRPALGLGIEIGRAEIKNKKILWLIH